MQENSLILDTRYADFQTGHPRASIRLGSLDIEEFQRKRSKFPEFFVILFYDSQKDQRFLEDVIYIY